MIESLTEIEPGLRRVLAPNPSPMTEAGTNTYIVGTDDVAIIDPGPLSESHMAAILGALHGARVSMIILTHAHRDHSALAPRLAAATGAPVAAFGPRDAGRSPAMSALAAAGYAGGGEGVDEDFAFDLRLDCQSSVSGKGWDLGVTHTPGHFGNHICLTLGDLAFTGDLVMGWASTLISPPDGDVSDFLGSLARLQSGSHRRLLPGHGAPVEDPRGRIAELAAHRHAREAQILAAMGPEPISAQDIVARIYEDTPEALWPAALRNVLAHLIDLLGKSRVVAHGPLGPETRFGRL